MPTYYCLATAAGLAKLAAAQVAQTTVDLTHFAVGDGGGAYYEPTDAQTALVNETWRSTIESIKVSPNNNQQIVVSALIPASSGGFDIREAAVFDSAGDLFAVGKYPLTNKPAPGSGSEKDIYVRMILELVNAASVTQTIDPSVVTLTRADLNEGDWKDSVRLTTAGANVNLAAAPSVLDGVTLAASDRVLVKNQTAAAENGIYAVQTLGTGSDGVWVRATDADSDLDVTANLVVSVEEGSANADSVWMLSTNGPVVLGTTALVFICLHGPGDRVDTHAGLTSPHNATSAATASRLMLRDASGRAKIAAPSAADDIARKDTVDTHAALTSPHSATSAATASRLMLRDASGRAKVAAPSAADDIARKDTVDAHANRTDNPHNVSAAQIGLAGASTTAQGIVELATSAEALAGADTTRAVTAAGLASAKLYASNGYQKLPGGLIIQWGSASVGSGALVTVTLPLAFPTDCLQCIASLADSPGGEDPSASGIRLSASQIRLHQSAENGSTHLLSWWAVGY